jgi:phosphate transport system substrate-binding protein
MHRRLKTAALPVVLVAAAAPAAADAKPTITMSGSTSVAPLAAKLARAYIGSCHHCVTFKLLQGGSDVGVSDVARGRVTIGNSSRDPKPSDPGGLVFNKVAQDGICLITNKANPVGNLSQSQVQSIFSGQSRDWGSVPGSGVGGGIDLFVRTAASGTQDAFQKIFMNPFKVSNSGIGYVSMAFTGGAHAVAYKGVACNLRNAKSGQYGGLRNFWMVTRGPAKGAAKKWIKWIQHSGKSNKIIATEWVPLH